MWFLNIEAFRSQEEEFMIAGKFEDSRDDHRCMLANIIADGETILLQILQTGLAEVPDGITVDDIKATLNSLHTAFYCEHGPKNSPQIDQLIEGLFDVKTA
jgi:hypothetical protein